MNRQVQKKSQVLEPDKKRVKWSRMANLFTSTKSTIVVLRPEKNNFPPQSALAPTTQKVSARNHVATSKYNILSSKKSSKRSTDEDPTLDYVRRSSNLIKLLTNSEDYFLRIADIMEDLVNKSKKKDLTTKQLDVLLDAATVPFPVFLKLAPLLAEQQRFIWKRVEAWDIKCKAKIKTTKTRKRLTRILSGIAYLAAVVGVVMLSVIVQNDGVVVASIAATVINRIEDTLVALFDRHKKELEEMSSLVARMRERISTLTVSKVEELAISMKHVKVMMETLRNMKAKTDTTEYIGEINVVLYIDKSRQFLMGVVRSISEMKDQLESVKNIIHMLRGLESEENPKGFWRCLFGL